MAFKLPAPFKKDKNRFKVNGTKPVKLKAPSHGRKVRLK